MSDLLKFTYTVTIEAATRDQAEAVIRERIGYDEELGFEYTIDATGPAVEFVGAGLPGVGRGGKFPTKPEEGTA